MKIIKYIFLFLLFDLILISFVPKYFLDVVKNEIMVWRECDLKQKDTYLDFFIENYNGKRTAGVRCVDKVSYVTEYENTYSVMPSKEELTNKIYESYR